MTQSGLADWKQPCGLDEITKIQSFLEQHSFQIKIYDKDLFNQLLYKGKVVLINNYE